MKTNKILKYVIGILGIVLFTLFLSDSMGLTDMLGMYGFGVVGYAALPPLVTLDYEADCNLAGIKRAYVIPVEDIATFAVPVTTPTTGEQMISIVGSHTLESTKYWKRMYSTQGKGTLNFTIEGERDFERFKIGGSLFYPSTSKEAIAAAAVYKGRDVIILVEANSDDGFFIQVGTEKVPARIKPSADWGTELNGEKGITFEIDNMQCNMLIYEGVIPISVSEIVS
jgi:hypothetical protein